MRIGYYLQKEQTCPYRDGETSCLNPTTCKQIINEFPNIECDTNQKITGSGASAVGKSKEECKVIC